MPFLNQITLPQVRMTFTTKFFLISLCQFLTFFFFFFLDIFNSIWTTGVFPPSWRKAVISPIPKPGKDHSDPNNYRPIALTSCLCKTMERMVFDLFVWRLESINALGSVQCGFRKNRSTIDHLVRFESFIRNALIKGEHVVSILFDLEKAYDTGNMAFF